MKQKKLSQLVGRLPEKIQQKIKNLSFEPVDEAAKRFVHSVGLRFKAGEWLAGFLPSSASLEGDVSDFEFFEHHHSTSHFLPFTEKVVMSQGSKVCIIGDVHGDLEYLTDVLAQLQTQGLLEQDYQLIDPTAYIALVGDYTNRNPHSVEVMLVLFYLYRHNLGRVFLLRGNHEYAISTRVVYDLYQQFLGDRSLETAHGGVAIKHALIAEMSKKFSLYSFPDLLYWFDFLPLATYLGAYDEKARQFMYMTVCHGGIEPGYSAASLLSGPAKFERLKMLDRAAALKKLKEANILPAVDELFSAMGRRLRDIGMGAFVDSFTFQHGPVDLTREQNPRKVRLGMQWNSFLTENNGNLPLATSQRHRNFLFGEALTRYFLEQSSAPGHKVISIIRGHQHLDDVDPSIGLDSPMLSLLRENEGMVRQWKGMVHTLGDGGSATGWQAFLIVTTGKTLEEWTTTHYYRADLEQPFESKTLPFIEK